MTDPSTAGRRAALKALLAPAILAAAPAAWAQAPFPSRPIRFVVGFPPGSAPDVAARMIAQQMREGLGQSVVVDNKPGAGGLLATQEVQRAAPDGHTLLLCGVNQISIAPHAYRRLPYDPYKDFAPVAVLNEAPLVLVSGTGPVNARDFGEYAAFAKRQKPLFLATMGAGTMAHFDAAVLAETLGVKPEIVHYRNAGDATTGLVNGDVHGMFASPAFATPQIQAGRLRPYATTSPSRLAGMPGVPTLRELGHPELEINAWFGLFAPAGTPAAALERLSAEAVRAVRSEEGGRRLTETGFVPVGMPRGEMEAFLRAEAPRWGRIVATSGFRADD